MSKKPAPPGKAPADAPKDDPNATAAQPDQTAIAPDPQVMMYLQVASAAFPRVQHLLRQQAHAAQSTADSNRTLATRLDAQTVSWVRRHVDERKDMEFQLEEMKVRKAELEKDLIQQKVDSEEAYFAQQIAQAKILTELRQQIKVLQADASEAAGWEETRVRQLKSLEDIRVQLEDTKEGHQEDIKTLNEENETERRKLRDLLVRKLRRVRDVMSSATDEDDLGLGSSTGGNGNGDDLLGGGKKRGGAAPTGGDAKHKSTASWNTNHGMLARDAESANLIAMFQTPTAKLNEKLSRAVTMYERESKSIADTISQMHTTTKTAAEQLEDQRSQNEKLVLRNASQSKAKLMLKSQLEELKEKYSRLTESHEARETERRRALQETVRTQGDVVADLRGELEHALNEYEGSSQELASLERQLKQKQKEAHEAHKFFAIVGSHHEPPHAADALSHAEAPPSGFVGGSPSTTSTVGSNAAERTGSAGRQAPSFTEALSLPGIPMLGLASDYDVAWFLAGV
ncbi:Hypothetical protein, putative, partial [Bodo saltans]